MAHHLQHRTHHHDDHHDRSSPDVQPVPSDADLAPSYRSAPSSAPTVVLRWHGGRPVARVSGEVDVAATAQLRSLRALLDQHGQRLASVDAAAVTFLDVTGLGALLELAGPGGSLLVLRPSPAVRRLLALVGPTGLGPAVLRAGPPDEALVLRDVPAAASAVPGARRRPR